MRINRFLIAIFFFCAAFLGAKAQETLFRKENDPLFLEALQLMKNRQLGPASQKFEAYQRVGRSEALKIKATYYIAYCANELKLPDAVEQLRSFRKNYPNHWLAKAAAFDLGKYYFGKGDYGSTIDYLNQIDKETIGQEKYYEAQFKMAYSYLTRKEFGKADTLFNKVKDQNGAYVAASNYYAAYLNIRAGRFQQALPSLDKADKDTSFQRMTPLLRTIVYYRTRKFDEAITSAQNGLKDTSKVSGADELQLLLAEALYQKEKWEPAYEAYQKYGSLANVEFNRGLQYRTGYAAFRANKYAEAVNWLGQIVESVAADSVLSKDSLTHYALYYAGIAYIKQENKAFALTSLEKARQLGTIKAIQELAWYNVGKLQFDMERFEDAIFTLRTFSEKNPNSKFLAEADELLSEAYLNTRNYDEGLRYIFTVKKRSPRVDKAFQRINFLKGQQLYLEGKYAEAIPYVETSLKITGDTSVYWGALLISGECHSLTRKYSDALNKYRQLLKMAGSNHPIYGTQTRFGIAYALFNQKEYAKAATEFREMLSRIDTNENRLQASEARVRLADCLYTQKNYLEAAKEYNTAIKLNGYDPDYAAFQKGLMYALANKQDLAIEAYEFVAIQYPGSSYKDQALYQKNSVLFDKANYQQAAAGFTALIESKPATGIEARSYLKRAQAYANMKMYDKASADFRTIIDEFPSHAVATDAINGLQESTNQTGNLELFNDYLSKFKEANPESKSTAGLEFEAAKGLYFSQKYDKSIPAFEKYLQNYNTSAQAMEARFYLGEAHYRKNERQKAIEYHEEVVNEAKNNFVPRSLARLAEVELAGDNFRKAYKYYQRLEKEGRNKKEVVNAVVGQMECLYALASYDSAIALANTIIQRPGTPVEATSRAKLFIGKADYAKGNADKAIDELLVVVNESRDATGAEAQYTIGLILFHQKKYAESIETLFDLNKNFSAYQSWYDKSFLLIADNYLGLEKGAQARYTLQLLTEKSPDANVRKLARQKLEGLK